MENKIFGFVRDSKNEVVGQTEKLIAEGLDK